MSALGQKRTCAVHQPMSASPPIATVKADIDRCLEAALPIKRLDGVTVAVIRRRAGAHGATHGPPERDKHSEQLKQKGPGVSRASFFAPES
jgi:hypothetical protein